MSRDKIHEGAQEGGAMKEELPDEPTEQEYRRWRLHTWGPSDQVVDSGQSIVQYATACAFYEVYRSEDMYVLCMGRRPDYFTEATTLDGLIAYIKDTLQASGYPQAVVQSILQDLLAYREGQQNPSATTTD